MKIATVIGGQGFIGSHLVAHLRSIGWHCNMENRSNNSLYIEKNRDLGYVFYCAGLTADYLQRPFDTVEAHVSLLNQILNVKNFKSLVYLSSTRLYDDIHSDTLVDEDKTFNISPEKSRHFYDLTKLMGESLCLTAGEGKARIARLSCVYDYSDKSKGFLPDLLQRTARMKRGEDIKVESSPYFVRDYIHITDVIMALINIASSGGKFIYNVASGENTSNKSLAELIELKTHRKIIFTKDNEIAPCATINIDRYKSEFNHTPITVNNTITSWLESIE